MKQYKLKICVPELKVDYTATCEAKNRQEAAEIFYRNLPPEMQEWKDTWILESWILTKEQKELEDSLEINL